MATFGALRNAVMEIAGVPGDMFVFRNMSPAHDAFWDEMNSIEFDRGYVPGEYEKADTPALCEMQLLTDEEFDAWIEKFRRMSCVQ